MVRKLQTSSRLYSSHLSHLAVMESVFPQLPAHCVPQSQILIALSTLLQRCVPSWQSLISTVLGLVSISSWLFAQIPQIIKNSKRGSAEGLSWGFLMMWLLGDICKNPPFLRFSNRLTDYVSQVIYWEPYVWTRCGSKSLSLHIMSV